MTTVHPDLQAILACPQCRGELEFPSETEEIVCPSCRLAFPIREGLPVMLIDDARSLPAEG